MSEVEGAPEEGVDDRYDWGDSVDPEVAQRFPKGPAQMYSSLNETKAELTRRAQAEAEWKQEREELESLRAAKQERESQWEDPLQQSSNLPMGVDEGTMNRLIAVFQDDPARAFELAEQAAPGYGPGLQKQIMQAWMTSDPAAAMDYRMEKYVENTLTERFQSFQDYLEEQLGPTLAHSTEQMSDAAVKLAHTAAPDMATYEPRIQDAITNNPALISDVIGNTQKMADRLVQLRDMLAAGDMRIAASQPAPAVAPKAAPRQRQATLGRSDAEGPTLVDDDYAKRMSIPKGTRIRGGS